MKLFLIKFVNIFLSSSYFKSWILIILIINTLSCNSLNNNHKTLVNKNTLNKFNFELFPYFKIRNKSDHSFVSSSFKFIKNYSNDLLKKLKKNFSKTNDQKLKRSENIEKNFNFLKNNKLLTSLNNLIKSNSKISKEIFTDDNFDQIANLAKFIEESLKIIGLEPALQLFNSLNSKDINSFKKVIENLSKTVDKKEKYQTNLLTRRDDQNDDNLIDYSYSTENKKNDNFNYDNDEYGYKNKFDEDQEEEDFNYVKKKRISENLINKNDYQAEESSNINKREGINDQNLNEIQNDCNESDEICNNNQIRHYNHENMSEDFDHEELENVETHLHDDNQNFNEESITMSEEPLEFDDILDYDYPPNLNKNFYNTNHLIKPNKQLTKTHPENDLVLTKKLLVDLLFQNQHKIFALIKATKLSKIFLSKKILALAAKVFFGQMFTISKPTLVAYKKCYIKIRTVDMMMIPAGVGTLLTPLFLPLAPILLLMFGTMKIFTSFICFFLAI